MQALVKANPQDAVARLTLLGLEDRLEGTEAIAALEILLATDAQQAFPRGKGCGTARISKTTSTSPTA